MDKKKSFTNRNSHPFSLQKNSLIFNSNPSIPTTKSLNDDENNNFMRMSNKFNIYDNLNNENNRENPIVLYKINKKKERPLTPKNINFDGNYISDGGLTTKSKKFNDSRNFVKAKNEKTTEKNPKTKEFKIIKEEQEEKVKNDNNKINKKTKSANNRVKKDFYINTDFINNSKYADSSGYFPKYYNNTTSMGRDTYTKRKNYEMNQKNIKTEESKNDEEDKHNKNKEKLIKDKEREIFMEFSNKNNVDDNLEKKMLLLKNNKIEIDIENLDDENDENENNNNNENNNKSKKLKKKI